MAESGRADYDRLVRFTQLEPGEPFFFVRGRDQVSGPAARAWAALAARAGAPGALVESALQQADRLDAWPKKRLPDADHLTRDEIAGLEYQLARRAWNQRVAHAPTMTITLAEQRGAAAAVARERHADRLLVDLVDALGPVLARTTAAAADVERARAALQRIQDDLALRLGLPRSAADPHPPSAAQPAGELVGFPGVPADCEAAVSAEVVGDA